MINTVAFTPTLWLIFGFFMGYFFKDHIGSKILKSSKFFTEGFSTLMLIAIFYIFYSLGVFNPLINWLNGG